MSTITFNKSLILRLQDVKTSTDALSAMADRLCEQGLVKDTYKKAILDREVEYPTGLYIGNENVAIPHADVIHVNKAAICVGVLDNLVKFNAMDDPTNKIDVNLVIMLALSEAHGHISMLQKVVALIQNPELVKQITESDNLDIVYEVVKEQLL